MGFRGVDGFSGEQKLARLLFANLPDKKNGNDCGKKADAHFRISKFRFGHSDCEVAQCGEAATAGDGVSVYRCDRRLWKTPDSAEKFCETVGVFALLGGRLF